MGGSRRSTRHPSKSAGRPAPPAPPAGSPRAVWWFAAGLALLTAAVFAQVAHFAFVTWDDGNYIHIEPVIRGLTWEGVRWAFTTGETANWQPVTWLSHMLDVSLYGNDAGGHHVTSLVLHTANVLLLFGVLGRMTGAWGRSAFVAALFAVHPLHVESVAWVAERKDVLSTLFLLLTLWAYVSYVRRPRAAGWLIVCGFYAIGLMSKPMLVTLPFVMLLLDVWPLGRIRPGSPASWRRPIVEKIPLACLAAAASVVTYLVQRQAGAMGGGTADAFPVGLRIENAVVSYGTYLWQAVWPAGLAAFYPYPHEISPAAVAVSFAILAGATFGAVRVRRQYPYVLVGWLWFVGMLVPVIGLVQVGQQAHADRYMYVPLVGIAIIAAWGVPDLAARRRLPGSWIRFAALAVVAASAIGAWRQTETWQNSATLWTRALAVTTDNDRAYNGLGAALGNERRFNEAIADFEQALRINPTYAEAHANLAFALSLTGRIGEALPHYAEALRLQPDHRDARNHYAAALEGAGRLAEAVQQYEVSLRMDPNQPDVRADFGTTLAEEGKFQEAVEQERAAIAAAPNSVKARVALGISLAALGRTDEAIHEIDDALRIDPANAAAKQALAQVTRGKV